MVKKTTPLKDKFKGLHPEILQMIEGMLAFDPENRMTLDQCLALKVFDGLKIKDNLLVSETKISVESSFKSAKEAAIYLRNEIALL